MNPKLQTRLRYFLIIGGIILLNLLGSDIFERIDLTAENRYSLSEVSKETADSLQFPMQVTVYMDGEFPPNVRALQDALRTTLIELDQYSGRNLEYEFVDPSEDPELLKEFQGRGFSPMQIDVRISSTESKQQYMWPLVRLKYGERESIVDLMKGSVIMTRQGPVSSFTKAEADLEYKLVSAIRKLVRKQPGTVLLLRGHGEIESLQEIGELGNAIESAGYRIATYDMSKFGGQPLPSVDVIIVLRPTSAFSERDKYELDQYLMRGGSIFFIMDHENIDMNVYEGRSTMSELLSLNLDDMFFKYGFKLNYDLIQDIYCATIELYQEDGARGNISAEKWLFFPESYEFPDHPISRNVGQAMARYAASIDTLPVAGLTRSVFYQSSPRSRVLKGQQFIDVGFYTQNPPPPEAFQSGPQIMGLLSEGMYTSLFKGREVPVDSIAPQPAEVPFLEQSNPSKPGKIVLISDGAFTSPKLFRGKATTQNGRPYPMPPDNKAMVMNAVDYLAGDITLSRIRSKDVVTRVLDGEKIQNSGSFYQWLNIALPLLLIIAFGVGRFYLRKRKHEKLATS